MHFYAYALMKHPILANQFGCCVNILNGILAEKQF